MSFFLSLTLYIYIFLSLYLSLFLSLSLFYPSIEMSISHISLAFADVGLWSDVWSAITLMNEMDPEISCTKLGTKGIGVYEADADMQEGNAQLEGNRYTIQIPGTNNFLLLFQLLLIAGSCNNLVIVTLYVLLFYILVSLFWKSSSDCIEIAFSSIRLVFFFTGNIHKSLSTLYFVESMTLQMVDARIYLYTGIIEKFLVGMCVYDKQVVVLFTKFSRFSFLFVGIYLSSERWSCIYSNIHIAAHAHAC